MMDEKTNERFAEALDAELDHIERAKADAEDLEIDCEFYDEEVEAIIDRFEAAHKRDVKELCEALRRLVRDTCGQCVAPHCEEPSLNGEPKMLCRVVFDALQVANRFDPSPKPTTADDEMKF